MSVRQINDKKVGVPMPARLRRRDLITAPVPVGVVAPPAAPQAGSVQPQVAGPSATLADKPLLLQATQEADFRAQLQAIYGNQSLSDSEKETQVQAAVSALKQAWIADKVKETVSVMLRSAMGAAGLAGAAAVVGFTMTGAYRDMVENIQKQMVDSPAYVKISKLLDEKATALCQVAQLKTRIVTKQAELKAAFEKLKNDPAAKGEFEAALLQHESLDKALASLDRNDVSGALAQMMTALVGSNADSQRLKAVGEQLQRLEKDLKTVEGQFAVDMKAAVGALLKEQGIGQPACEACSHKIMAQIQEAGFQKESPVSAAQAREIALATVAEDFPMVELPAQATQHFEEQVEHAVAQRQVGLDKIRYDLLVCAESVVTELVVFVLNLQLKLERESMKARQEADTRQAEQDAIDRKIAERKTDEKRADERGARAKAAERQAGTRSAEKKSSERQTSEAFVSTVQKPVERANHARARERSHTVVSQHEADRQQDAYWQTIANFGARGRSTG